MYPSDHKGVVASYIWDPRPDMTYSEKVGTANVCVCLFPLCCRVLFPCLMFVENTPTITRTHFCTLCVCLCCVCACVCVCSVCACVCVRLRVLRCAAAQGCTDVVIAVGIGQFGALSISGSAVHPNLRGRRPRRVLACCSRRCVCAFLPALT